MPSKFILKIVLISSIFFASFNHLQACSCAGEAYFCHELSDTTDAFVHPDFVIKGVKLKDTLHGMFVRIEQQFINEILEDTILIWGDPGHLCRVYTSNFEVGESVILGIKRLDIPSGMPQESIGDYWLPACGITFLKIENGFVVGPISMGSNAMLFEDFEFYMENEVYKTECVIASSEHHAPFENKAINLYPNPARDMAFISCENCEAINELIFHDAAGQIKNIRFTREEKLIRLYTKNLEKGVYFIKLKSQNNFRTYKLLVI